MSGDISLSNTLGGLRIANPDEEAVGSPISPTSTPTQPFNRYAQEPPDNTIAASPPRNSIPALSQESAGSSGVGFNPDSYSLQHGANSPVSSQHSRSPTTPSTEFPRQHRLSHRKSLPLNHQAQQAAQFATQQAALYGEQFRGASGQSAPAHTVGGMYQLPNTSSSSTGSYRYRDDMNAVDVGASNLARNGSRSASGAGGVPVRIPERNGSRSYRSTSRQINGGNGPLPPRRHSPRARAPTNGSGTGYEPTSVPYSGSAPQPGNADEWRERGGVSVRQETDATGQVQTRVTKKGVKDFNFGRTLGEGSYSTVLAATDRQNNKEYAIKVLDKRHIIKEKKVKYVNIERDTLNRLTEHPGIVRLYYTFQDERSLYFVLDLATGGELLGVLKKMGSFDVECTRFYGAQILDSIAYMHSRGVIHRDLKPENVLLDREMHTKITDFGTAKILPDPKSEGVGHELIPGDPTDGADQDRATSFVGTAEYVSPELLQRSNACKASDLWAFGCIIYQLLAGRPPFKAANEYLTFQKILGLEYSFPDGFPPDARDLVERLLVVDPANRLPVEHIKNHPFFEGIQWGKGLWRQKAPKIKPYEPPPPIPIKLNGAGSGSVGHASAIAQSQVASPQPRPQLRGVADLPPPSQLDIDWSPVLGNNERILKLGNLVVTTAPPSNSPNAKTGDPATPSEKTKLRSFFSGNANKRRERLVMITSNARLVVAAAGGNEKKAKMEVDCLANGTSWMSFVDGKGLTAFQMDTREKHLTFEDPRATTSDPAGSKFSTQEWLDALDGARETAMAQTLTSSYSGDSLLNAVDSNSPPNSAGADAAMPMAGPTIGRHHHMRQTLRRNTDDSERDRGKRFSKRHSKSGLAAVF